MDSVYLIRGLVEINPFIMHSSIYGQKIALLESFQLLHFFDFSIARKITQGVGTLITSELMCQMRCLWKISDNRVINHYTKQLALTYSKIRVRLPTLGVKVGDPSSFLAYQVDSY